MQQLVDLFGFFSVLLRAGTLVFQSLLLGGIFFVLWTARGNPELPQESMERVHSTAWTLLRISAIGLAVVQVLYLFVDSSVLMSTAEIPFRGVIGAGFFISGSIVLGGATLTAIVAGRNSKFARYALPVLAAVILGASLMTTHAASRMGDRFYPVTITAIHLAATGLWIGGLPFLMLSLFRARDLATRWYLTERFSRSALFGVGALALSGLAMSFSYIGSVCEILGTAYGVMVSAKVLMLGALLVLGAVNFLLLRGRDKENVMPRLRRLVEAEVGIGITVILTAASLTSQPPAVDQPNDTVTPQQIAARVKPVWPRLDYPQEVLAENAAAAQGKAEAVQFAACCRCVRHRWSAAHVATHCLVRGVGVKSSLDGGHSVSHGRARPAGAHRQGALGRVLAFAAHLHCHFHLHPRRHRILARWAARILGLLAEAGGLSAPCCRTGLHRFRIL